MDLKNITKVVKYCCNELNLPIPNIKILDDGFGAASCSWENGKCTLTFVHDRLNKTEAEWQYESIWRYIGYTPKFKWEYAFLIIAHEIAHAMQYQRHWMWLVIYTKEIEVYLKKYKKFSLQKYNEMKVEANANKVALILLKRAKKNKFKLDK